MLGGKAFAKPLPFPLGGNEDQVIYGIDDAGLAIMQGIGMTLCRDAICWTTTASGTGFESTPGTYDATVITAAINVAAAVKSYGMNEVFVICTNQSPGFCPTLSSALSTGGAITSLPTSPLIYAVTSGDSIVITSGDQAHTQTFVASSGAAAGATAIPVNSQTPNFAYAGNGTVGTNTWVYDTAWDACTPQHFATAVTYLVSELVAAGHGGLIYEWCNEPDGSAWGVDPTLLAQAFELAWTPVTSADPTCIISGPVLENMAAPAADYYEGTNYYNLFKQAGGCAYRHRQGVHQYSQIGSTTNSPPDAPNVWGFTWWQMLANFRYNMLNVGAADSVPIMVTEVGWPSTGSGPPAITPQLQSQFFQNLLVLLSGKDPINNVLFSSYLDGIIIYEVTGNDSNYGIAPAGTPNPAVAVLTELVSGH